MALTKYDDMRTEYLNGVHYQIEQNPLRRLVRAVEAAKGKEAEVSAELQAVLSLSKSGVMHGMRSWSDLAQLGMDDRVALSLLAHSLEAGVQGFSRDDKMELALSGENSELVHRVVQTVWHTDLGEKVAKMMTTHRLTF